MHTRARILAGGLLLGIFGAASESLGWDKAKAFENLEARQRRWAEWRPAQKQGGACMSCHTGVSYMLARRAAGEPARGEVLAIVDGVRSRVRHDPATPTLPDPGAEVVLNLLALALHRADAAAPPGEPERAALAQLWKAQQREGPERGSWSWVDADLEPFDATKSRYLGTAFAALALAQYPGQPPDGLAELQAFLSREASAQPLHNRLAWAAFAPPADRGMREAVLAELWKAQSADGGWTSVSLGPWTAQPEAPPDTGSNAYATAWAAYAARQAGTACADPRLQRALAWLEKKQDAKTGAWWSPSMNKVYPSGSIQEGFMSDAASGYAAAVLVACQVGPSDSSRTASAAAVSVP